MKIAIIGECMVELANHQSSIQQQFGGDTLNSAIYLARANPKIDVYYVTALGNDVFSNAMLTMWQAENIHTDLVQRLDNKLPGLYWIENDPDGERTFYYWRNDSAARYWLQSPNSKEVCEALFTFDYLYLSGISLAILSPQDRATLLAKLAHYKQQGGKILFDNNYRPRLWQNQQEAQYTYQQLLPLTDMAFLTLDDECLLWGDNSCQSVIARNQHIGIPEFVIKRGGESAVIVCGNNTIDVPALPLQAADIVDTTAAGDAFSAGYLAVRLAGGDPRAAACYAHTLAGTVIQHRGAIIDNAITPLPSSLIDENIDDENIN